MCCCQAILYFLFEFVYIILISKNIHSNYFHHRINSLIFNLSKVNSCYSSNYSTNTDYEDLIRHEALDLIIREKKKLCDIHGFLKTIMQKLMCCLALCYFYTHYSGLSWSCTTSFKPSQLTCLSSSSQYVYIMCLHP